MGELYKKLFKVILICGIITLVAGEILFFSLIIITGQTSHQAYQEARDLTASGKEVNDTAGYGALADYIGSGFMKIIQIFLIFISVGFFISITIYLVLYYIAVRLFKNGESKDKMSGSILLISIAGFIKLSFIVKVSELVLQICISDFSILLNWYSILILISYISEIVSIIFTLTFYIKNLGKIKGIYNERIEE